MRGTVGFVTALLVGCLSGVDVGGRRKGSAPEGEAWLLEGTRWTSTPAMRRNVWLCWDQDVRSNYTILSIGY